MLCKPAYRVALLHCESAIGSERTLEEERPFASVAVKAAALAALRSLQHSSHNFNALPLNKVNIH